LLEIFTDQGIGTAIYKDEDMDSNEAFMKAVTT
jgi:hypothetical protein